MIEARRPQLAPTLARNAAASAEPGGGPGARAEATRCHRSVRRFPLALVAAIVAAFPTSFALWVLASAGLLAAARRDSVLTAIRLAATLLWRTPRRCFTPRCHFATGVRPCALWWRPFGFPRRTPRFPWRAFTFSGRELRCGGTAAFSQSTRSRTASALRCASECAARWWTGTRRRPRGAPVLDVPVFPFAALPVPGPTTVVLVPVSAQ